MSELSKRKISGQDAQLRSLNPLPSICGSANVHAVKVHHRNDDDLR